MSLPSYSLNGVTISVIRDIRKKDEVESCPVRIRVTHKRKQVYYSTGISLTKTEWEKLIDTKSKSTTVLNRRADIAIVFDINKKHVDDLVKSDMFTFEELNYRLGRVVGDTVNNAFNLRVAKLVKDEKLNTADGYKYALKSIESFAGGNIAFSQVTIEWLKRYERFMLAANKSYTTISMYMRALQVIINEAKNTGLIKQANHPFGKGKYEIPQHEGRNMALTVQQIGQIVNFECPTDTITKYRDLWYFSYLCNGANVADICKLKYSNIINGEICFYRQKTIAKSRVKKQIKAVMLPDMEAIIGKWGNPQTATDSFILPFMKGYESAADSIRIIKNVTRLMNRIMQKIGADLGIHNISSYTARHSYATVLKRSGANIAYISESLGHSDIRITESYLDQFESEERQKNAMSLTKF